MKRIFLITTLLVVSTLLFAQNNDELLDARPVNSININLLGDASIVSINYERQYSIVPGLILTGKMGVGIQEEFQLCFSEPCVTSPDNYVTIPQHITLNRGNKRHFFELGFGGTLIGGHQTLAYIIYPIVGYRFLPLQSDRFNFRIFGQIPLVELGTNYILFIPFGLSLGISF